MADNKISILEEHYIDGDVRFIEGFFETGADLPTDNIATGSNMYDFEEGKLYWFKASSGEWITKEEQGGE